MTKNIVSLLLILIVASVILGQGDEVRPVLESSQKVFTIINNEKIELTEQNKAKPGQVLLFENEYVNTGNDVAKGIQIDIPIAEAMDYIDNSAECEDCEILFSIDNGDTYSSPPIVYNVIGDNGEEIEKTAIPGQYTDIRFIPNIDLDPDNRLLFSYKLQLSKSSKEEK